MLVIYVFIFKLCFYSHIIQRPFNNKFDNLMIILFCYVCVFNITKKKSFIKTHTLCTHRYSNIQIPEQMALVIYLQSLQTNNIYHYQQVYFKTQITSFCLQFTILLSTSILFIFHLNNRPTIFLYPT